MTSSFPSPANSLPRSPGTPTGMIRTNGETHFHNTSTIPRYRDTYPFIDPYRFRGTLVGKVVLIPNAAKGVAKASALAFAEAGATVVMTAKTMETLQPVLLEISQRFGLLAYALNADFSDATIPSRLVDHVEKSLGRIDILLNVCAGSGINSFCHETDFLGNWWSNMERIVRTPIALIHAVLPGMVSRGEGTIISTTGTSAIIHVPFTMQDSTARAALLRFHTGLHHEVGPKGIKSFVVNPGMIASYLDDPDKGGPTTDPAHFAKEPRLREEITSQVARETERGWASTGLASGTFLALAADERCSVLSGLYINAERDLESVMADAELGDHGRIATERLYALKLDEL